MSKVSVQNFSLHHIDIPSEACNKANTKGKANDLDDFINNLLAEILDNDKGGDYTFSSETELVPSMVINTVSGGNWEDCTSQIANKLLREEIDRQQDVRGIANLMKGSLLQVKGTYSGLPIVVIMKIEHDEYVDEEELKYHSGLPTNRRRLQKSSVVFFDDDFNVTRILKSGNPNIAEYWWKRFFSCEPLTTSHVNTSRAYVAIDKFLKKEVKKISSGDYYFLINEVNSYFKKKSDFVYEELVGELGALPPENEDLKPYYDGIIAKLKNLPKTVAPTKKFDTQFEIDFSAVKARVKRKIVLAENFELSMKGDIDQFKKIVKADTDSSGRKYIKIYSDSGYDEFS